MKYHAFFAAILLFIGVAVAHGGAPFYGAWTGGEREANNPNSDNITGDGWAIEASDEEAADGFPKHLEMYVNGGEHLVALTGHDEDGDKWSGKNWLIPEATDPIRGKYEHYEISFGDQMNYILVFKLWNKTALGGWTCLETRIEFGSFFGWCYGDE